MLKDTLERVQELIDNKFEDYGEDWITRIKDEDRKILDNKLWMDFAYGWYNLDINRHGLKL
ncbi:hypothetical protein ACD471_14065|uniref:hypothetical protein n=1 Tax=Clostridioides difficile TaxID=1496 RepID=UPI00355B1FF0